MHKLRVDELSPEDQSLVSASREARTRAYAPYSRFTVGSAVRAGSGKVYAGCNVENATYHATHAERNAIDTMVAAGEREILALAVASEAGGFPCAECRQMIWEFAGGNPNLKIIGVDQGGTIDSATIGELYPEPFGPEALGVNPKES